LLGYALAVAGIAAATLIPIYIALYLLTYLKSIPTRYLAGLGLGLALWYFIDTMGDAAYIDVNEGFTGGLPHLSLVVAFILGVTALSLFDYFAVLKVISGAATNQTSQKIVSKSLFLIPAAVAGVSGIHGLGEGWDFSSVAHYGSGTTLTAMFGGLQALASYPAHKFLEASIFGVMYVAFVGRNEFAKKEAWHLPVLGLLFGLPSVIGASIGYSVSLDTTVFYAFGVTSAMYAALRLVEAIQPTFVIGQNNPAYLGGRIFLALAIGFFLLYLAALLHG
jgi:hypothetical protein